jgi:hypothetical protein
MKPRILTYQGREVPAGSPPLRRGRAAVLAFRLLGRREFLLLHTERADLVV